MEGFSRDFSLTQTELQRDSFPAISKLLAGLLRKRHGIRLVWFGPKTALNGTTALHMVALQGGARLLRAHDVAEAQQTIDLFAHAFQKAE